MMLQHEQWKENVRTISVAIDETDATPDKEEENIMTQDDSTATAMETDVDTEGSLLHRHQERRTPNSALPTSARKRRGKRRITDATDTTCTTESDVDVEDIL